jgi:hypothetical protein
MSIAVLTQVHQEIRRIAIAGSVVAPGDFRLKKHLAPLEQAGAKAPVFAKVAEAVKNVVESNEKTSADAVLELTTLVNAILYTQGETGLAGDIAKIETTDLGAPSTQASARMLKPLLEALTTTGSGRIEQIKDAHERGMFRDFRLVKPALAAIDDVYGEIASLVSEKILPQYGKAILPELRAKIDLKGRAGHPRRLKLMHALDPEGTRPLVKEALDSGSKEVKVVAVECLGGHPEDLNFLLEQSAAKAQEVRRAAYWALATINDDAVVAALQKAAAGKDLQVASAALGRCKQSKVIQFVIAEADKTVVGLAKVKDKKDVSTQINRVQTLSRSLFRHKDKDTEDFILRLFGKREEIAKIKGAAASGSDLNSQVAMMLASGTPKMQRTLIDSHGQLSPEDLLHCVQAARRGLSAEEVYDIFSPYVSAKADEKKKKSDPASAKREAICDALDDETYYPHWQFGNDDAEEGHRYDTERFPPLDPRWLDLAVAMKRLELVTTAIRPGHAGANAFLQATFDERLKKSKDLYDCSDVVRCMFRAAHPGAVEAVFVILDKHHKKLTYLGYWLGDLVRQLPKSEIPRLEALVPKLPESAANQMIDCIQQIRERKDA